MEWKSIDGTGKCNLDLRKLLMVSSHDAARAGNELGAGSSLLPFRTPWLQEHRLKLIGQRK